jgi:hypothetical protein
MSGYVRRASWIIVLGAVAFAAGPAGAATSSACSKARQNVAREESAGVRDEATLERSRKGRASCATKQDCARYDEGIRMAERRMVRHESRLAKLRAAAAGACSITG